MLMNGSKHNLNMKVQKTYRKEKLSVNTELIKLYNTLKTIETKGDDTKTMADCLRFLEQLIATEQTKQSTEATE